MAELQRTPGKIGGREPSEYLPSPNGSGPHDGPAPWPEPLGEAAYHGLAGKFVRKIEPESEADPNALLVQLLVNVGVACGRNPYLRIEDTRHGLNEFCVIAGDTSTARKGTSFNRVRVPVEIADEGFSSLRITGLSSGEGLIYAVRDETHKRRKARGKSEEEQADEDGYIVEVDDPGVTDKRLLIYESEFANVLAAFERSGNTLDAVLRLAFDGDDLRVATRQSPLRASAPHIGMVAHITQEELRRRLTATEAANGFGNRFLWVCARRSKLLPLGGGQISWGSLVNELARAIGTAKQLGEVGLDEEANQLFKDAYRDLSADRGGLLGAITSRAAAHVRRLAAIYAVLDRSREARRPHVEAALEVWRYSEHSCRHLFGGRTGNPVADVILEALRRRAVGWTRTEISGLFGRNVRAHVLDEALLDLAARGLAYRGPDEDTGGRPSELWFATTGESR